MNFLMMHLKEFLLFSPKRIYFVFIALVFASFDKSHIRVVDDFITHKNWESQVINHQNQGPLYNGGFWSDPIKGPTFKADHGKGIFHFPKLEYWVTQGFEYDYRRSASENKGLEIFDKGGYLTFNIRNESSETVWMKFRLLSEITYTYNNPNGKTDEESLVQLVTSPDTFLVKPGVSPQRIRLKILRPELTDPLITDPVFENQIKFFAFETRRTKRGTSKMQTIDCSLVIDHLQIENDIVEK